MIKSIDELTTGKPWPPHSEVERLDKYKAHRLLYQRRHEKVFDRAVARRVYSERTQTASLMPINYPKRLVRHWVDLIWKNSPAIKSEIAQDDLELLLARCNVFDEVGPELTTDRQLFGDGLLRVYLEDGRSFMESISPEGWLPVKGRKMREPSAHVLFDIHEMKPTFSAVGGRQVNRVITFEIYTDTAIERRAFRLERESIGPSVPAGDFFEVEQEATPAMLLVPCHGDRTSGDYHGYDDITDIEPLVAEMEVRISQINKILDTHSDPISSGPDLAQRDPTTGESYANLTGSFHIPTFEGQPSFQYHTWDGQLNANFEHLDRLIKNFYFLAETTPAAFGIIDRGTALSGVALRLMMFADEAKADRITISIERAMKTAIETAGMLEGKMYDPEFMWKPVIVSDEVAEVENNVNLVGAGLRSKLRAVKDVNGLDTDEAAEAELERVAEESASTSALTGGGLLRDRLNGNRANTNLQRSIPADT